MHGGAAGERERVDLETARFGEARSAAAPAILTRATAVSLGTPRSARGRHRSRHRRPSPDGARLAAVARLDESAHVGQDDGLDAVAQVELASTWPTWGLGRRLAEEPA